MRVGMLLSRVRVEEKLLLEAFEKRGVAVETIDDRELVMDIGNVDAFRGYDVIMERCINHSHAIYTLKVLNAWGVRTVNTAQVIETCGDKAFTTVALMRDGIPSPRTLLAYSEESALKAIEMLGYPAVLKPTVGSWGRLISRVNDRDAAEDHPGAQGDPRLLPSLGVLHPGIHRQAAARHSLVRCRRRVRSAPSIAHSRALDHQHGARRPGHQLPHHARRGRPPVARGSGGRGRRRGSHRPVGAPRPVSWSVNEVNYTMEFRNSIHTTGVDIPGKMVDYVLAVGRGEIA